MKEKDREGEIENIRISEHMYYYERDERITRQMRKKRTENSKIRKRRERNRG